MTRIVALTVVAFVVSAAVAPNLDAQCALCRTALESSVQGQAMAAQFNRGILFLLGAPFTVAFAIATAVVRSRRRLQTF